MQSNFLHNINSNEVNSLVISPIHWKKGSIKLQLEWSTYKRYHLNPFYSLWKGSTGPVSTRSLSHATGSFGLADGAFASARGRILATCSTLKMWLSGLLIRPVSSRNDTSVARRSRLHKTAIKKIRTKNRITVYFSHIQIDIRISRWMKFGASLKISIFWLPHLFVQ